MIKIGMLLPYEDMLLLAKRVIEETGIQVDYIKVVNTVDAVNEARRCSSSLRKLRFMHYLPAR